MLWLPMLPGCSPAVAEPAPEPPKVTVAHPEQRTLINYDEYNGWTEASATVEVRARVRGHIDKVDFVDGQFVKTGDLLFELDPRPFQSEIDRAKEQVTIAQAQQEAALKEEERQLDLQSKKAATKSDVERAIATLPEGARHVLVLQTIYGYSHEEVADMLGIAVGTCKAQLHRGRKLLRERMGLAEEADSG